MSNSKINLPIYQSICFLNSQVLRQVKCLYAVLFEYLSLHDHSFLSFIDYYQLAKENEINNKKHCIEGLGTTNLFATRMGQEYSKYTRANIAVVSTFYAFSS